MDRIQIEPLIPENNRKRNFHESENESEEDENGLLGRICKKVKSALVLCHILTEINQDIHNKSTQ